MTGPEMLDLVLDLVQRRHGDYEFGPSRVVVPWPLRRFMDSDYNPLYPGRLVLERVLGLPGVRAVQFATVPVVILEPDETGYRGDDVKEATRLIILDPTLRGLYVSLDEYNREAWLVFADRLEELNCLTVAATIRHQHRVREETTA